MDIPSGCCWEHYHCNSDQKCKRNDDPEVAGVCAQEVPAPTGAPIGPAPTGAPTVCYEHNQCDSHLCRRDPERPGVCAPTPEECAQHGGMDIPSGCCWENYQCNSDQCRRNDNPEVAGVCAPTSEECAQYGSMDIPTGCCWEHYHCNSDQKCKRNDDPEVAGVCAQEVPAPTGAPIGPAPTGAPTVCYEHNQCDSHLCKRNSDPERP